MYQKIKFFAQYTYKKLSNIMLGQFFFIYLPVTHKAVAAYEKDTY
jgi:hypothetical protein